MVKKLPAHVGDPRDTGSIPGWERIPGEGNGNPLQYSCLETPMNRGAWWATVHRVAKSWTQLKRLSMHAHHVWDMVTTTRYLNRLNNGPSKEGYILISRNYEYGT